MLCNVRRDRNYRVFTSECHKRAANKRKEKHEENGEAT